MSDDIYLFVASLIKPGWVNPCIFADDSIDSDIWMLVDGMYFWVVCKYTGKVYIAKYNFNLEQCEKFTSIDPDTKKLVWLTLDQIKCVYWPSVKVGDVLC